MIIECYITLPLKTPVEIFWLVCDCVTCRVWWLITRVWHTNTESKICALVQNFFWLFNKKEADKNTQMKVTTLLVLLLVVLCCASTLTLAKTEKKKKAPTTPAPTCKDWRLGASYCGAYGSTFTGIDKKSPCKAYVALNSFNSHFIILVKWRAIILPLCSFLS